MATPRAPSATLSSRRGHRCFSPCRVSHPDHRPLDRCSVGVHACLVALPRATRLVSEVRNQPTNQSRGSQECRATLTFRHSDFASSPASAQRRGGRIGSILILQQKGPKLAEIHSSWSTDVRPTPRTTVQHTSDLQAQSQGLPLDPKLSHPEPESKTKNRSGKSQ